MAKVLTSLQHPLVKHLVHLRQNRDYREDHGTVFIEGLKMVSEVATESPLKVLVITEGHSVPPGVSADEIVVVTEAIMHKISGVQSPEGLVAEVEMPSSATFKKVKRLLVCDGINDPGNLGTLIRTALALDWEAVFLLENSCDPFNEKALRAAKGATFRLPLGRGNWKDLQNIIKANRLVPLAGDMAGDSAENFAHPKGLALVLSNEAQGISPEALNLCQKVSIPMSGDMESLNVAVAGGILMYLLREMR